MSFLQRLFKFRIFKFRTTLSEELEDLHTETIHLQQTLKETRLQQLKWTKWFAIYAALAYIALNLIFYRFFLPTDYLVRTYDVMISILIGVLLYGMYWLLCWYFRTVIQMKEDRISLFKDRKKELIEEVKNKETYAVAKTLLEKYGETITPEVRPSIPLDKANNDTELRQRVSIRLNAPAIEKPAASAVSPNIGRIETFNQPMRREGAGPQLMTSGPPGKLARAILPPQRTFWGAILDTIVGDGPSKRFICDERLHERWKFRFRYALICKSCNSHNGMALEEEFEYISFRCAYCNYYNSARKQKPVFHGSITSHDPQLTSNEQTTFPEELRNSSSNIPESLRTNELIEPLSSGTTSSRIETMDIEKDRSLSSSSSEENLQNRDAANLSNDEN